MFLARFGADWYQNDRWDTRDGIVPYVTFYVWLRVNIALVHQERLEHALAATQAIGSTSTEKSHREAKKLARQWQRIGYPEG